MCGDWAELRVLIGVRFCIRLINKPPDVLVLFQSRMWELLRKRQQYQQVRKPKVADCGMDRSYTDGGSEKQTTLPTAVLTFDSLRERLRLSPSPRRQPIRQAATIEVAPSDLLDPKSVNDEVCLLTDSPYRILRVSGGHRSSSIGGGSTEWRSYMLNFCPHLH
jgi:hypothetical protein